MMQRRTILGLLTWAVIAWAAPARGDLNVDALGTPFIVDFDTTVAGVNNGGYAGTGFEPGAPTVGRLDSNGWAITGVPTGLAFGETRTSGEFARGASSTGVSTDGVWSFDIDNSPSTIDRAFGFRPSDADFTPGTITLRVKNSTGSAVESWSVSYDIFVWNNQNRSNSLNFAYSTDGTTFTPIAALDFLSPGPADASPAWVKTPRATVISALVASAGNLYLQWRADDVSGSSSRDSFAFDNVSVTAVAVPEPGAILFCGVFAGFGAVMVVARRMRWAFRGVSHVEEIQLQSMYSRQIADELKMSPDSLAMGRHD